MTATAPRHRKSGRRHRFQWPSWLLNWAWRRHATPHIRNLTHELEIAHTQAWIARVEHHEPSPAVAAACAVAALIEVLPDCDEPVHPPAWAPVQPHQGPVPDAMADNDPRYPHLARQWEYPTGTLAAVIDQMGDSDA